MLAKVLLLMGAVSRLPCRVPSVQKSFRLRSVNEIPLKRLSKTLASALTSCLWFALGLGETVQEPIKKTPRTAQDRKKILGCICLILFAPD